MCLNWYDSLENGQMQTDIWVPVFIIKIPDPGYITRTIRYTSTRQPSNALNQIEKKREVFRALEIFMERLQKSNNNCISHALLTGRNWVGCIGWIIKLTQFSLLCRALLLESMLQPKYKASLPSQLTEQKVTSVFWLMTSSPREPMNRIECSPVDQSFGCTYDQIMQTKDLLQKVCLVRLGFERKWFKSMLDKANTLQ